MRAPLKRRRMASFPWWLASTAGAVLLTVGAVWFWADNWGSSFANRSPTYIPSEATASTGPPESKAAGEPKTAAPSNSVTTVQVEKHQADPARVRGRTSPARAEAKNGKSIAAAAAHELPRRNVQSASAQRAEPTSSAGSRTVATVRTPPPPRAAGSDAQSANTGSESAAPTPARKTLVLASTNVTAQPRALNVNVAPPPDVPTANAGHVDAAGIPVSALPVVGVRPPETAPAARSKPAPVAASIASVTKPKHQHPLEGEWVYAPPEPEKGRPGFYPPEFIDLQLVWDQGGLHGQYRAKYQVADKPIPPNVNFTLSPDGSNKFIWQASNGSRGIFKISSVDKSSIRVEWKTTVYSHALSLTAGTATLVKKTQ